MRNIKKIIIHVSDSEDSLDIGVREIRNWHVNGNGWSDIGYHAVIRRDGTLEQGRKDHIQGAHVAGHNRDSLGICWVGRKNMDPRQYETLKAWVRGKMHQYSVDVLDVVGHYELDSNKTCPNIDMDWFRADLLFKDSD